MYYYYYYCYYDYSYFHIYYYFNYYIFLSISIRFYDYLWLYIIITTSNIIFTINSIIFIYSFFSLFSFISLSRTSWKRVCFCWRGVGSLWPNGGIQWSCPEWFLLWWVTFTWHRHTFIGNHQYDRDLKRWIPVGPHVVVLGSWESIFFKTVRVKHQSWCLFVYRSTCFLFHRHTFSSVSSGTAPNIIIVEMAFNSIDFLMNGARTAKSHILPLPSHF